jgi:multicomponent Na+:H+ antiporter subunit E
MSGLARNFVLALIWALLTNDLSVRGLAVGFVLGLGALAMDRSHARYVGTVFASARLLLVFLHAVVVANVQLAVDVLRPRPRFDPAIVRFDAPDLGPSRLVLLATLVSLTPGSLTIGTDPGSRSLFVHTLYDGPTSLQSIARLADLVRAATGLEEVR